MEGYLTGNQHAPHEDEQWAAFLDRLVHDLREPMRSMHVFTELLEEKAKNLLGAQGDGLFSEIHGGATSMRTLIDGLSHYSLALHETQAASVPTAASLQSAFRIVSANLDDQIRSNQATVTASALPRVAVGLERSMQLLENLIANSLRFRAESPPVIQLSAREEDDGMWAVSVKDNGIGIAPENCEAIFQPFMKVEGRKFPGAGLGLSICKRIVEAHGGSIVMQSAPGQGSVCTFTLPGA
jgi:signal transduction histidine kinase